MPPVRNSGRAFGWKRDTPDHRDLVFRPQFAAAQLPPRFDLDVAAWPLPFDQGDLGSCTANAIAAAVMYDRKLAGLPFQAPSRLFVYYQERVLEGTVPWDAGAELRDGMKAVAKWGSPDEALWPYDVGRFRERPSVRAYKDAGLHLVSQYLRVAQDATSLKAALFAGHPVVLGFTVYTSFLSDAVAATGAAPMPQPDDRPVGGHAVLLTGWDDAAGLFRLLNSWGASWGDGGYFTLPYGYLTNPTLAADFWTIRSVSDAAQPTPPGPGPFPVPPPGPWPWPPFPFHLDPERFADALRGLLGDEREP